MNRFIISSEIIDQKWDSFVIKHPEANIFQTSALFEVYQQAKGYWPFRFWAIDVKTREVLGVLQGVVVHEKPGLIGKFSTRAIIQGGPLLALSAGTTVLKQLVQTFDEVVKHQAIWSEIWNFYDTKQAFRPLTNYHSEDHLNFVIDLARPEEVVWREIHESRRKNINRAMRKNLCLEEVKNQAQLDIFYRLVSETYQRVKVPLSDSSLFVSAYQILVKRGLAKFFLAKYNNDYIGARVVLTYKKEIYDWYAGASSDSFEFYPNDYLVWSILKWGIENGYGAFDFGGAGKPNVPYGPREFKRRFGGKLTNFGRLIRVYSPWKYKLAHWGFKVYQFILNQLQNKGQK